MKTSSEFIRTLLEVLRVSRSYSAVITKCESVNSLESRSSVVTIWGEKTKLDGFLVWRKSMWTLTWHRGYLIFKP